ncbi:uncharacterized protein LOC116417304 [Nasonia vitripennis]|uniref:Uncharacterized protein n=1 Tax=Nasonia vitripennis TaxID=7425 RepID=A0A7M7QDT6_NASVI|nr:uncharacterized protein LOC116417304 [Nasonia vitripennis]
MHKDIYIFIKFKKNTFGISCAVCDRLWWTNDLKTTSEIHNDILEKILLLYQTGNTVKVCSTCKSALDKKKIPILSTYNGFSYLTIPAHLPDPDFSQENFKKYKQHYKMLRSNLENIDYINFEDFYTKNNISSDEYYYNVIRAGINRPKLFYRRMPSDKWHNPFNPFVFHHLQSNTDFQIIQDEYACAAYVVEYVNKHNRGISTIQIMDENPEFDIVKITRKMSVDVLNSVEMSAQEAAWNDND